MNEINYENYCWELLVQLKKLNLDYSLCDEFSSKLYTETELLTKKIELLIKE